MIAPVVQFFVRGEPIPQGSMKAFAGRTKKGRLYANVTSDNPRLKDWRGDVRAAANAVLPRGFTPIDRCGIVLLVTFVLPRPKSIPKRQQLQLSKPDLDKMLRGVKDALTNVVWADDKLVVGVNMAKFYAREGRAPGAVVTVVAVDDERDIEAARVGHKEA